MKPILQYAYIIRYHDFFVQLCQFFKLWIGAGILPPRFINLLGDNLFNLADIKNNTYISNSDGSEISYNGWSSSDYIDLGTCKNILIVSDSSSFLDSYNALYNENKETQRILRINKATITNDVLGKVDVSLTILKLQENERYIRISQKSSLLNHIKIFRR